MPGSIDVRSLTRPNGTGGADKLGFCRLNVEPKFYEQVEPSVSMALTFARAVHTGQLSAKVSSDPQAGIHGADVGTPSMHAPRTTGGALSSQAKSKIACRHLRQLATLR